MIQPALSKLHYANIKCTKLHFFTSWNLYNSVPVKISHMTTLHQFVTVIKRVMHRKTLCSILNFVLLCVVLKTENLGQRISPLVSHLFPKATTGTLKERTILHNPLSLGCLDLHVCTVRWCA